MTSLVVAASVGCGGDEVDPGGGSWRPTSVDGAPIPRVYHGAVWAGDRMLVWGGFADEATTSTGGAYDLRSDSWTPLPEEGAPSQRQLFETHWTGTEMLVWGGKDPGNGEGGESLEVEGGGLYDPVTDQWRPVSTVGAPPRASRPASVWTGAEVIVWGGGSTVAGGDPTNLGGVYDPSIDEWRPTSLDGAPSPRPNPRCVWTGQEMFIWGEGAAEGTFDGALYDPVADHWRPVSSDGAPSGPAGDPLWTGGAVLLTWAGPEVADQHPDTMLSSYDPETDTWTPLTVDRRLAYSAAVWTGSRAVFWRTIQPLPEADMIFGGVYEPATDTWGPISHEGAPALENGSTTVWTGEEMIVWGGSEVYGETRSNIGGRYLPSP